jgi:sugar phosphate isomerase/epimerase
MEELVMAAEIGEVTLCVEPETANVVDDAERALRLLEELASFQVRIAIDAANLFHPGRLENVQSTIEEAVRLLGPEIVVAHAKDIASDGAPDRQAAGRGDLDFDRYFKALAEVGFDGPIVLHNLSEAQVRDSVAFVREKARKWFGSA